MFPAQFEYHRPDTLAEAIALLAKWPGEARCLAGGQSLIPSMKLRLSQPAHLIDLAGIAQLRGISIEGNELCIGAMTSHVDVESSAVVIERLPCLSLVASNIADPQVRNRGTLGGSLANADPAADYPASLLALDGIVEAVGPRGPRSIAADQWFVSLMTTALRDDEIVTRVRFPLLGPREAASYVKVPHPASRFAVVGIAAKIGTDAGGVCTSARIAGTGIGEMAQRAPAAEALLIGKCGTPMDIDAASARAAREFSVIGDGLLGEAAKRQLCLMTARKVLTRVFGSRRAT